jgi:hypothetical protein
MKPEKYTIKTVSVFAGAFEVRAEGRLQATRIVNEDCGMVSGGKIHTTAGEAVTSWDFPPASRKNTSVSNRPKMKRKEKTIVDFSDWEGVSEIYCPDKEFDLQRKPVKQFRQNQDNS